MADFVWGQGGTRLTPEDIAAQRKVAQALMAQGADYSPIASPWQGAARLAQGLIGGYENGQLDRASAQNGADSAALIQALIGGGASAAAPAASPVAAMPAQSSVPVAAGPLVPNDANAVLGTVGMNQRLADLSQDFIDDNPGTSLSSGVRSTADQARLYADRGSNPNPVAFPGTSKHERGQAIDIGGMSPVARALLPQYGLAQPVANDPPHVELAPQSQMAAADPAALPVNAAEAQGYAIPGQPAPAPAVSAARPAINPAIAQAISNPYISDQARKIATMLFQNNLEAQQKANDPLRQLQIQEAQSKMTPLGAPYKDDSGNLVQRDPLGKVTVLNAADKAPTSVSEYKYYRDNFQPASDQQKPMDYATWSTAKARAAATNITNNVGRDEDAFQKEAGKVQAQRFNDLAADGQQAHQLMSDVTTLTDLGKNIGTGKSAEFKAAIGPYAEALGVPVKGLSDIQAYEGIVNRVAPSLRVKGSGAQSDYELKNFLKSLPALGNTEEGNAISAATMKGLQENKIRAAEIGSQAINGEISRAEADRRLRSLPDPMADYREYMKTNRGAPTAVGAKTGNDGWQDLGGGIRIREKK